MEEDATLRSCGCACAQTEAMHANQKRKTAVRHQFQVVRIGRPARYLRAADRCPHLIERSLSGMLSLRSNVTHAGCDVKVDGRRAICHTRCPLKVQRIS